MATATMQLTSPFPTVHLAPGSVNVPIAKYPSPSQSTPGDPSKIANQITASINRALQSKDPRALSNLFVEGGYWRDHLAITWYFRTVQGPAAILKFLEESATSADGLRLTKVEVDESVPHRASTAKPVGSGPGVYFFISVETAVGTGQGIVHALQQGGEWKIFTLYTSLRSLKGHEEQTYTRRPVGVEHGGIPGRMNWDDRRKLASDYQNGSEPAVFILGAGQAGLTAAARLKAVGVDALVIDSNDRIGDNWRKRYHQLVLHDPVWFDHLPYIPFPPQWPIFTPKDKLAEFFEAYSTLLELNVWTRTDLVSTKWDEDKKVWAVTVNRRKENGTNEERTFHPRHIIQATGHSGKKNMPSFKGVENFKGDRVCHSSEFDGARDDGKGRKIVVVGSCNSAHDICQDYLEKGYEVTMVQRSSTCVVSSQGVTDIAVKGLYDESAPPVDDADLIFHSKPMPVFKAEQYGVAQAQADLDKDTLEGLTKAGFKIDRGPDDTGLMMKYFQRGGGYYIDVGASKLIAEGKIKVKHGQEIDEILAHGLRFADGSEVEADEIILATGYQDMRSQTRATFGDEVADRVGSVWGFNDEGEMRTVWQRSGHPGFWFHGGNLALCRYYSQFLALQIKALEVGVSKYGEI